MKKTEEDKYLEKEFDFKNAVKNPYAGKLKKQITININEETVQYFKEEALNTGIPYQTLINLFLQECVRENRKLKYTFK